MAVKVRSLQEDLYSTETYETIDNKKDSTTGGKGRQIVLQGRIREETILARRRKSAIAPSRRACDEDKLDA